MRNLYVVATIVAFFGSRTVYAYDVPKDPECVIDQCNEEVCSIETPEGWVSVEKKPDYREGKVVACPIYLIDPT